MAQIPFRRRRRRNRLIQTGTWVLETGVWNNDAYWKNTAIVKNEKTA
jgi:hypothetical protein